MMASYLHLHEHEWGTIVKKYRIKVAAMCGVTVAIAFATQTALAQSQVLSYDFTVTDVQEYSYVASASWSIPELSEAGTEDVQAELTYTVQEDNNDDSFDVLVEQASGTRAINGGQPAAIAGGSSLMVQEDGRGKILTDIDPDLLLPSYETDSFDRGTVTDQTGLFTTMAVDVTDTWTQTFDIDLPGQSTQPVTANCELLEWTTLNGHNVAKIKRSWTQPVYAVHTTSAGITISGDIEHVEYFWFSYGDHLIVKRTSASSGTLTMTTENSDPDDEYDLIVSTSETETLQ